MNEGLKLGVIKWGGRGLAGTALLAAAACGGANAHDSDASSPPEPPLYSDTVPSLTRQVNVDKYTSGEGYKIYSLRPNMLTVGPATVFYTETLINAGLAEIGEKCGDTSITSVDYTIAHGYTKGATVFLNKECRIDKAKDTLVPGKLL